MVLRDDRELLAHLAQVNSAVPDLALRLMNGQLPAEEQRAFAQRLADVADTLLAHADRRDHTVLEHEPPVPAAVLAAFKVEHTLPDNTAPVTRCPRGDRADEPSMRTGPSLGGDEQVFNLYEARTHLSRLVDRAADGERIVIARHGRPVARLTPASSTSSPGPTLADVHAQLIEIRAALPCCSTLGRWSRCDDESSVQGGRAADHRSGPWTATRVAEAMSDPAGTAC